MKRKSSGACAQPFSLRQSLNLSQADFAKEIGYSTSYVGDVEVGKTRPSRRFLEAVRSRFGISIDQLLGLEQGLAKQESTLLSVRLPKESVSVKLYGFSAPCVALGVVGDLTRFLEMAVCLMGDEKGRIGFLYMLTLIEQLIGEIQEAVTPDRFTSPKSEEVGG